MSRRAVIWEIPAYKGVDGHDHPQGVQDVTGHEAEADRHALNEDGMVLCNPRDREAAHRAEMEGITTDDHAAVTCRKCLNLLSRLTKEKREQ